MKSRGHARVGGLVGSLLLHAVLLGGVASAWRPPTSGPPPPLGPEVELVWLQDVRPPSVEPVSAPPEDVPAPMGPAAGDVAPASDPGPARPRERDAKQSSPPTPPPRSGDAPSGTSLSLSGLRGSARPASGSSDAVVVPALPPPPIPPPPAPRIAEGPARPRADDVEPRSLEEAGFKRNKDGSYKLWKLGGVVTAKILPSGRIEFRDRALSVRGTTVGHAGTVGQALAGEEQFKAIKAQILRETFELRLQMAQSWSKAQMRKQLAALDRQLERTWTRTEWTATRRREVLFTLWDDCEESAEEGESSTATVEGTLDQARAVAGTKARKQIVAFIRETLPAGSSDAYRSAELDSLNASRHSRQRFEPYAD